MKTGAGSPPRRRGRRHLCRRGVAVAGLTPAQAGTAGLRQWVRRDHGAHPRAGGDGVPTDLKTSCDQGSPPRRRGRRRGGLAAGDRGGLTPAQAGTASGGRTGSDRHGAHPRAGGDGCDGSASGRPPLGSPPRRRGRRRGVVDGQGLGGLTPAQAGTASTGRTTGRGSRAHPRAGGDGANGAASAPTIGGSPPRRRGRPKANRYCRTNPGLTPAQAGTAGGGCRPGPARRAHPRAGGDGRWRARPQDWAAGSPPRRRGRPRSLAATRAHPRAGGDGRPEPIRRSPAAGSPPRRRGRHYAGEDITVDDGLTPAQAGTARPRSRVPWRWRAHPRAGGDGERTLLGRVGSEGSPPRRRGRPASGDQQQ